MLQLEDGPAGQLELDVWHCGRAGGTCAPPLSLLCCRPTATSPSQALAPSSCAHPTLPAALFLQDRKLSPLQRGGTLQGAQAAGKDASDKFKSMAEGASSAAGPVMQIVDGRFRDYRWINGTWDMSKFKKKDGEVGAGAGARCGCGGMAGCRGC